MKTLSCYKCVLFNALRIPIIYHALILCCMQRGGIDSGVCRHHTCLIVLPTRMRIELLARVSAQ